MDSIIKDVESDIGSEAKNEMQKLIQEKTPEAKQKLVAIAQSHGIPVNENMDFTELENKIKEKL